MTYHLKVLMRDIFFNVLKFQFYRQVETSRHKTILAPPDDRRQVRGIISFFCQNSIRFFILSCDL